MIDWDRVEALRDEVGSEDFDEVVDLFLMEVDEEIATLDELRPGKELAEKLHFLKGSALSLGFQDFSALCQSGETGLNDDPGYLVNLQTLRTSYENSRIIFERERAQRLPS